MIAIMKMFLNRSNDFFLQNVNQNLNSIAIERTFFQSISVSL